MNGARPRAVSLGRDGGDGAAAAGWLRGLVGAVALHGAWAGGSTILSSHPLCTLAPGEDPFAALDTLPAPVSGLDAAEGRRPCVGGGWIGFLGFELAGRLERLTPPPAGEQRLPRFHLAFHDHVVRRSADGEWSFEALWTAERARFLEARLDWWRERLAGGAAPPPPGEIRAGPLEPVGAGLAGHRAAVAEAVRRIHEGELSQANICLAFEGPIDGDPLELWRRATSRLAPAYSAYLAGEDWAVASLSPELFLRRDGRTVQTRPIKGTATLDVDPARLAASVKDRAENVMIVDLMRNDLGRVCAYGTVHVPELCAVEPAAGVQHLVSTVRGRLHDGAGDQELLRATFPPGSVTGAPKIRALRVIHELEGSPREVYCGAIGIRSPLSGLELNVAIRTLEVAAGRLRLGAGGGIVADSDPDGEVAEAVAKAAGVAGAAGIALALGAAGPAGGAEAAGGAGALPALRRPRPDPRAGVLETIRVRDGAPRRLAAHLSRLAASCRALGLPLASALEPELRALAHTIGDGAMRVRVADREVEIEPRPLPASSPMRLVPVALPGGLGAHKWADRSLVDAVSSPGVAPLICELDATVLEAGYAAVVIVAGDVLIAPPLDGRILPSISRAAMLAAAPAAGLSVAVRSFRLGEALGADGVLLCSSLRGPHPGLLEGGPGTDRALELCARLRD